MITVITFFNASTQHHYIRLKPGIIEDEEKDVLCKSMNAEPAVKFKTPPTTINLLYFQEFESDNTNGVYFSIDGDREIHEILTTYGRVPDYII